MIEVNLLPGGRKSAGRGSGGRSLSLPQFSGSLPKGDPWVLGGGAAALVAILVVVWLFSQVAGEAERLEGEIASAQNDSVRLAEVIRRTEQLQARRDSIAQRVEVIQEIDGARYVWPHLMDEVARALPDYTWLSHFAQMSPGELPTFRIQGRAGTVFALTTFMENLEASPFIGGVRLLESDQAVVDVGGGVQRPVYQFTIEAGSREPPAGLIETVPLFGGEIEGLEITGVRPATAEDDDGYARAEED